MHIKNFRSIVDETIDLSEFNCFVGKNDSGKSNVLKALNLFFNGETEINTPLDFNSDFSKFAKPKAKAAKEIVISLDIEMPSSFSDRDVVWTKKWRSEGLHDDNKKNLFSARSRGVSYLDRIKYLYIPAVKSDEYFKKLLSDMYMSMTNEANTQLSTLNKQYSQQLQRLTKELSTKIHDVLGLQSELQMPEDLSTLFRDLSFFTSDNYVHSVNLKRRGDGIKVRHIPSILKYMQNNTEGNRPRKSVKGSYIWGFEEPENGIEYSTCFDMAKEFYNYIDDCQILITTHSPAFYIQSGDEKSHRFYVEKNAIGASKYRRDIEKDKIYKDMGLMQMMAPFIYAANQEIKSSGDKTTREMFHHLRDVFKILFRSQTDLCDNAIDATEVLDKYSVALDLLDDYDHLRLEKPQGHKEAYILKYEECRKIIKEMKFSNQNSLFGNEKDDSFKGSIGNIYQSFGGQDCYPSVEEKAAHLLYFITKNHSFSDGNKRIAGAIFVYFLNKNGLLYNKYGDKCIDDKALVAIIVMIAESRADEKDTMIKLIMNFLATSRE